MIDRQPLRKVCAWCKPPRIIDGKGPIMAGEEISHGICPKCLSRQRAQIVPYPTKLQRVKETAAAAVLVATLFALAYLGLWVTP